MDATFSLSNSTVAIVGLGLMGGSLAMALRGHCRALAGFDSVPSVLEAACQRKIVDRAESNAANILRSADVVILAAPVPAILKFLEDLPSLMSDPCVVMDLGSSKGAIVEAMASLPVRFDPIGGHPLCGKEKLSLEHAEGALYQGKPFVLTRLQRTSGRALAAAHAIIDVIGARPVFLEASEHDRILASTSHMPYLLSSALALATAAECSPLAGPGFRSTSRLAGTPSSMMLGVLETNRDNVLTALHAVQQALGRIELALASEDLLRLEALLDEARTKYAELVQ